MVVIRLVSKEIQNNGEQLCQKNECLDGENPKKNNDYFYKDNMTNISNIEGEDKDCENQALSQPDDVSKIDLNLSLNDNGETKDESHN